MSAGDQEMLSEGICRRRSITTTLYEYGGLFESLHEGLADGLEATIQATRAGRMRDEGGMKVLALRQSRPRRGLLPAASEGGDRSVGRAGFEPATRGLKAPCSNQAELQAPPAGLYESGL